MLIDDAGVQTTEGAEPEERAPVDAATQTQRPPATSPEAVANRHRRRGRRVPGPQARLGMLTAVLDRLPQGVVLVHDDGRIVMANRTGRAILADGEGLCERRRQLTATAPDVAARLQELISAAASAPADGSHPQAAGAMTVARTSLAPLSVLVTPASHEYADDGDAMTGAVVFVSDPARHAAPCESALERLYGFTPTQARLACRLAAGVPVRDAAKSLGVTLNTARTHVKHLFEKTGARRQSDLVRMVLVGPANMLMD